MVEANVKPLCEELRLKEHEFALEKVTDVRVRDTFDTYTSLSGAWVLADTRSDQWEKTKGLFFPARN